jgi:hypothetical protein
MNAGRELDALVAEKVMGWKWQRHEDSKGWWCETFHDPNGLKALVRDEKGTRESHWWPGGEMGARSMPSYSTEISAAWEVVEKMVGKRPAFFVMDRPVDVFSKEWRCAFDTSGAYSWADSAPFAICLAALKAVGVEVPDA